MSHPPRRPARHGGDGDGWVFSPDGETKRWGRYGAAGVLAHDPARGVLLQHRVEWSHFGGTWGIPGGARNSDETALEGALREANEEAGLPAPHVRPIGEYVTDLGWWSYTTEIVRVEEQFTERIADSESLELAWVRPEDVEQLALHPGFAASWPTLRESLDGAGRLIVDAANVVGSTGNTGWWRDRAGAAQRLIEQLTALAANGVTGELATAPFTRSWPEIIIVLEGEARVLDEEGELPEADHVVGQSSPWSTIGVRVVSAPRSGDDSIVELVADRARMGGSRDALCGIDERGSGRRVRSDSWTGDVVVTADRELRDRVHAHGARSVGPKALLAQLGSATR